MDPVSYCVSLELGFTSFLSKCSFLGKLKLSIISRFPEVLTLKELEFLLNGFFKRFVMCPLTDDTAQLFTFPTLLIYSFMWSYLHKETSRDS